MKKYSLLILFFLWSKPASVFSQQQPQQQKLIITTRSTQEDDSCGNNFFKALMPPLAGLYLLNFSMNPHMKLSPAFLFRGFNGMIAGIFDMPVKNSPLLLRSEAGILGFFLVAKAARKFFIGVNEAVLQPTIRTTRETITGLKEFARFVKNHKEVCLFGTALAASSAYLLHQNIL